MLSWNAHRFFDYVISAALILTPFVFGFHNIHSARNLFLILGLGMAVYTAFLRQKIPVGAHVSFDVTVGILVMLAPYLFGYEPLISDGDQLAHGLVGALPIALSLLTRRSFRAEPRDEQRRPAA